MEDYVGRRTLDSSNTLRAVRLCVGIRYMYRYKYAVAGVSFYCTTSCTTTTVVVACNAAHRTHENHDLLCRRSAGSRPQEHIVPIDTQVLSVTISSSNRRKTVALAIELCSPQWSEFQSAASLLALLLANESRVSKFYYY